VLNNIFYDFDKATLRDESKSELEQLVKLMNDNSTIRIELSSHTDNKGSEDYNIRLSQGRAQSVVDYLVKNGISNERLVAKGYGKSMPVATNETDEGRQQNRRTEFKILSN
jgi:outer membrane protein OmpA-like peptidoglycan-associated protein